MSLVWLDALLAAAVATGCGARTDLFVTAGTGGSGASGSSNQGAGNGSGGSPLARALSVSAGSSHACAVTASGAAKCWGHNANGQLGDGSTTDSHVPVDVVGLSSDVLTIAAGTSHTCAVTHAGAVKCWGWNEFGQLGNGSRTDSHVPVDVAGLSSGVTSIAAGNGYTCAVTSAGAVQCWGNTVSGGGGIVPGAVTGLSSGVLAVSIGVAAGSEQACAVTSAGAAKCWGGNAYGEIGDNSTTNRQGPVDVVGLSSGVLAISAGNGYTCAVTVAGAVKCWGGDYGEFNNSMWGGSLVPVDVVAPSSGVLSVSAGNVQACAMTSAGAAQCWGENDQGQLGDNSTTKSHVPVDVVGLSSDVIVISAGSSYSCAATHAGAVKCWGYNGEGELGNGSTDQSLVPVEVVGF